MFASWPPSCASATCYGDYGGMWEVVYIVEGLLANTSDIQPDTRDPQL